MNEEEYGGDGPAGRAAVLTELERAMRGFAPANGVVVSIRAALEGGRGLKEE